MKERGIVRATRNLDEAMDSLSQDTILGQSIGRDLGSVHKSKAYGVSSFLPFDNKRVPSGAFYYVVS